MPIQHTNHVEVPALKLKDGNAFQAIGTLRYNLDFTKERTMRHFVAHKKRDPSPFISTMASLSKCKTGHTFFTASNSSQRTQRRG
jgi:hypothetical protein